MISVEHIMDGDKSLLTVTFDRKVMKNLKAKCDDKLNFYQSEYRKGLLTLFKADTGYRITRVSNVKKTYKIQARFKLDGFGEFKDTPCSYFIKKNKIIRVFLIRKQFYDKLD